MKSALLVLSLAALMVTQAVAQENSEANPALGKALVASNAVKLSADRLRSASGYPGVFKTIVVPYSGTVRVAWEFRTAESGKEAQLFVQSGIGLCSDTNSQTTFKNGNCVVRVFAGAILVVNAVAPQSTVSVKNVRIAYDLVNATGKGKVLAD